MLITKRTYCNQTCYSTTTQSQLSCNENQSVSKKFNHYKLWHFYLLLDLKKHYEHAIKFQWNLQGLLLQCIVEGREETKDRCVYLYAVYAELCIKRWMAYGIDTSSFLNEFFSALFLSTFQIKEDYCLK